MASPPRATDTSPGDLKGPHGPTEHTPSVTATDALRFARQAESAAAAKDRDRTIDQLNQAFEIALTVGTQSPGHRMAESIHALMEALAQTHQGRLPEAREDMQSAIVWLSRAAGLPDTAPSASWSARPSDHTASRKEKGMNYFVTDIEEAATKNRDFRRVLFTGDNSQLVLMSLKPGEDIGPETHGLDQFIRVEAGHGTAHLNGKQYPIHDGSAIVIPAGTRHNIVNESRDEALKLYTLYSPPEHKDGTVHATKQEAQADQNDQFDGRTSMMLQEAPGR